MVGAYFEDSELLEVAYFKGSITGLLYISRGMCANEIEGAEKLVS